MEFKKFEKKLLMGTVSNALLRSKNTEHNSFPQSSASWQSCANEMRAEVVDFPEVKPHWCSDNGEKVFK